MKIYASEGHRINEETALRYYKKSIAAKNLFMKRIFLDIMTFRLKMADIYDFQAWIKTQSVEVISPKREYKPITKIVLPPVVTVEEVESVEVAVAPSNPDAVMCEFCHNEFKNNASFLGHLNGKKGIYCREKLKSKKKQK